MDSLFGADQESGEIHSNHFSSQPFPLFGSIFPPLFLLFFLPLLLFMMLRRVSRGEKIVVKPILELDHQSDPVSNPGQGKEDIKDEDRTVKKSRLLSTNCSDDCLKFLHEDCKTLAHVIERGARAALGPSYHCLGSLVPRLRVETPGGQPSRQEGSKAGKKGDEKTRGSHEYVWISYGDLLARTRHFGSGLLSVEPHVTKVGIFATNCVDYVVAEFGAYRHSLIVVPLYDTLGPNAVSFVIRESALQVVIVDSEARFSSILSQYDQDGPLSTIILINQEKEEARIPESVASKARGLGLRVHTIQDVERIGAQNPRDSTPPRPRDLAVICYTSGTTGDPKGAMLSHENIISNLSSVLLQLGSHAPGPGDTYMSFLPLAHMFERCSIAASLMVGARIGFFGGNIKELNLEMEILAPTFLPSVPRLFNRIYDKVHSQVSGSKIKRFLLQKGLEVKGAEVKAGIFGSRATLWDKLIFNKVKDGMGGKVRLIVVGSAPTSPAVLHFMRCALSCIICEGYGQTECVCPCTLTLPGDPETGHVGPPLASAFLKLIDVPEMEYWARDNQGEVCVKGPLVFQGYLNDGAKTASVIDNDGWLHTGDIGRWNPNGTLSIIDRKRNIFKLSQGEYICPERIEAVYARSRFVAQIFVYGESIKSSLVAIVVPDPEVLLGWARASLATTRGGTDSLDTKDSDSIVSRLCSDLRVKQVILEDLHQVGRAGGALRGFEQVRDIYLTPESFSIQNGLLTPTLKTKRTECRKFFGSQIQQMYRGLD